MVVDGELDAARWRVHLESAVRSRLAAALEALNARLLRSPRAKRRRYKPGTFSQEGFWRPRASGFSAASRNSGSRRTVNRLLRAVLAVLPRSVDRADRSAYAGFPASHTRSYGRFSLLAMSVIDQETHIKTSSAAAASPRRRPASFRVSRYVVSKKE